jgi:putative two-component system response regulator
MTGPDVPAPSSVVLVDDDPLSLALLRHLVASLPGTSVVTFTAPQEALDWCRTNDPDLVITDQQMPGMTGTELVRALREEPRLREVPILMVTTVQDPETRREALLLGANDYIPKPLDAVEAAARVRNMLALRQASRVLARHAATLQDEVRRATAAITHREHEVIVRLARAAEYRDWETGAHILRVAWYARLVAAELGLPSGEQDTLFRAAPMHDVGKIGVPDYILLKPSGLDDLEFKLMKEHTVIGHRILADSDSELLQMAASIALTHHERFDGTGYPEGLIGDAIPICGRIVAVADTFDALTSERPYKSEWPVGLALEYLRQNSGARFDPECVRAFLGVGPEIARIRTSFPDTHGRTAGRPLSLVAPPDAEARFAV